MSHIDPFQGQPSNSSTSDRRRGNRQEMEGQVHVTLDTVNFTGRANNLSKSGILYFTDGDLRVTVQLEEKGELREVSGTLVRCERIRGESYGWAVEFDH